MDAALKSSNRQDWETPSWLFDFFNKRFKFDLDVCANQKNTKLENFYSEKDDAFKKPWVGKIWMNPPYGSAGLIQKWIKKAHDEASTGKCTVVALLPARTDTVWFHDYCARHDIFFIRRRIKFVGGGSCATFPSCIVVFKKERILTSPSIKFLDFGVIKNGEKNVSKK
jgi:phage N-6-adenine-methyltransferase